MGFFCEISARVVKNRSTWKTIVFLGLLMQTVRLSVQTISDLQSQMIWTQPADYPNGQQQYAVFRKTFYLDDIATKGLEVEIFADSRYLLWINGKYVSRGPVRFNPKSPEYEMINQNSLKKQH